MDQANSPRRPARVSGERRLKAAQGGSAEALGQTLEGCRRYLLWVARRELDPGLQARGGASDLVQETFLEAQRDFPQFSGTTEAELLAWLRRLLLNNLSNFVRHHRGTAKRCVTDEVSLDSLQANGGAETDFAGDSAPSSQQASDREQVELLRAAVARLPEEYQRIITLWHEEERSFEDIARQMGCAPNTVRNKWLKAIKQLQKDLHVS